MKAILTLVFFSAIAFSCHVGKQGLTKKSPNAVAVLNYLDMPSNTTYICDSLYNQKLFLSLDTIKNTDDNSYAIGQLGKCNPKNKAGFKVGQWTEYYESGNIKSQGNYGFGLIRNCCSSGYCYGQYAYKTGSWIYYYEGSQIKASIIFDTILSPIKSMGCGDTVYYKSNSINTRSQFFDANNNTMVPDSLLLNFYLKSNDAWINK